MKCIALYHIRFEDLGSFAAPIEQAGYAIEYRHAGAAPLVPAEWVETDLIIVLGGPIGVHDTAAYPWLQDERMGLARRLAQHRPTLGVCLGAQLMAVGLGGEVVRRTDARGAHAAEIGWSPLDIASDADLLAPLKDCPVLHWHGDNIVLPSGVPALASTRWTPCQAFAVGRHALGLQCHVEFAADALEEWLSGHAVELAHAGVDLDRLRRDSRQYGDRLARAARDLLLRWLDGINRREHP